MFTGLYPHTHGHRSLLSLLKPEHRNLFRDLKDAGYGTAVFGKNDLLAQESIPLCFDETACRVQSEPLSSYMPEPFPDHSRWKPAFYLGKRKHEDCHDGDWACVQSALQFLDEPHDRPFCIYLPLSFVHPPYQAEDPFFSMHDIKDIPEPASSELSGKRRFTALKHRIQGMDRLTAEDMKEIKRLYFGMTSRVDHQFGLLIDRLRQRGLYDSTVIAVFSDHGDYAGDYGMIEKYPVGFEDCLLHVPLILSGPGIEKQGERTCLTEMTDLYPTLMDLAGLKPKHYHFGQSLIQVIRGTTDVHREAVFAEGGHHIDEHDHFHVNLPEHSIYFPMYRARADDPGVAARTLMIRTGQWKYVYSPGEHNELYDLEKDPQELRNCAGTAHTADIETELQERLLRWMLDTGDVLPPDRDPRGWRKDS
jgi:arylsulfatase A-like enzyme